MLKVLRRGGIVVVALCVVGGGAYAVKTQLLDDDDAGAVVTAPALRVQILKPGTFASSHSFAPYYVIPRKRFKDPSKLTTTGRNKLLTQPESALTKGAIAGSPQIVRLSLRAAGDDPVTVDGVRFKVVSDARPLRGWYTALTDCMVKPVRRAKLYLDSEKAAVRYVGTDERSSRKLSFSVGRTTPSVIELQASTEKHRVAWTAELLLRDEDGNTSTVAVDDRGEPFRVTSARSADPYRPIYGASGIIGYAKARGFEGCD